MTRENAVVVAMLGAEYAELGKLTLPSLTAYAARLHANFHVLQAPLYTLGDPELPMPYEKYQLYGFLSVYSRVLFLDPDIIVRATCPNLFDVVPKGQLGAYNVRPYTALHDRAMRKHLKRAGVLEHWDGRYFNGGVLVLDRAARPMFDLQLGVCRHVSEWGEQTQLNVNRVLLDIPLFDIGYKFNHTSVPAVSKKDSHILHFAGGSVERKMQQIWQARKECGA